jgi:NAD(P)-dependent dehydrogenase (short-subunit alcohol dehydrogenase family)
MTQSNPQTWWITGAGDGIGRALTTRLIQQGHTVHVSGRSRAGLDSLAADFPGQVHVWPVDVADRDAVLRLFADDPLAPRSLDGILLSAGICEYIDLPALDSASVARVTQVNFLGVVHACEAALPLLRAAVAAGRAKPQIIGVGSMSSYVGFPRAEGYGASKAAMAYFLDALRCDVGPDIDVTTVFPGFVSTRLTAANDFPMPFQWTAEQAADFIVARLGRGYRYLAFPWQLHWLLRLAQWLPGLWYGVLIPRLARRAVKSAP